MAVAGVNGTRALGRVVQWALPVMEDQRETIWGIDPGDRQWFQLLTLFGGVAGAIILTYLELTHQSLDATPGQVARNVVLGIGASFVSSGFITWGLLQAKELIMAIADWIRKRTARDLERRREQAIREGIQQGLQQGLREGYERGYADATAGKPKQPPTQNSQESP